MHKNHFSVAPPVEQEKLSITLPAMRYTIFLWRRCNHEKLKMYETGGVAILKCAR